MKHFTTSVSLFTQFLIVLLTMSVLICSAKMTGFLTKREQALAVSRGTIGVIDSEKVITESIKTDSSEIAQEAFDQLTDLIYKGNIPISEEEINEIYRKRFYNNMISKCGGNDGLHEYLESKIPSLKTGSLSIDFFDLEDFSLEDKLDEGEYVVALRNIPLRYQYKNVYSRRTRFDVEIPVPKIVLFDGNDEIFSYSLIADKGIYITGKTSTIFGNIYAGTHGPEEMRKSEALYGERERYGGLNIMSTQVAAYSEKIISEGDVNLRGSFVIFGSEETPTTVKTYNVNQIDNIAQKNIFAHVGTMIQYLPNEVSEENINDNSVETSIERKAVAEAIEPFEDIEFYYDSNNDKNYTGRYRKIISSTDVTLKNDVTGIVMTPRSVIVEEGVNVEGLIISGDRIYIQGNNNIVSSKEVLRNIVKEEFIIDDNATDGVSEDAQASDGNEENSIHLHVKDYLGGIKRRGIIQK